MRIKHRLASATGLVAIAAIVLTLLTLLVTRELAGVVEDHRLTWQAGQSVAHLQAAGYDYLIDGTARAMQQWQANHARLVPLLEQLQQSGSADSILAARAVAEAEQIGLIFNDFVSAADGMARLSRERADLVRLHFRHLQVELIALGDDLGKLDVQNSVHVVTLKRHLRGVALVGFLLTSLAVAIVALWLHRTVLRPLALLTDTLEGLDIDDLHRRTGIDRDDEVGDLARAFDRLLARLQRTSASRDRLEMEVRRRARAERELQRSNHELEQFAYVASHDLQEPLRTIASFLQLFLRRYGEGLDKPATEYLDFAVDGARRMKVLIDDLLTFSRVGTRGKPFQSVDLNAVIAQVQVDLANRIAETDARIEPAALPTLLADQGQMAQLFRNLILNAIRYRSEAAPLIRIEAMRTEGTDRDDSTDEVAADASTEGAGWIISVADNGIGIEPQYFERIFVIFQRLHTRAEYPGTGIGLAVCQRIVERHGGHIWVESEPGHGAVFLFSLPDAPQA